MILLTDHGVYWRVASTKKEPVNFIQWPENESCDLLAEDQQRIFQAYKADPANHKLPATYHEDMVWSVEVLGRLIAGEPIPPIITHVRHTGLFGQEVPSRQVAPSILPREEEQVRVKKEKVMHAFQNLKRSGPTMIDLDSPSPAKAARTSRSNAPSILETSEIPANSSNVPPQPVNTLQNPELPGLPQDEEDYMPKVGEGLDVEACEEDSYVGGCSDKTVKHEYRDICGVLVLQWFGLPVQCHQHGPFSVANLNSMLAPFGLQLGQCSAKTPAVDGKYLCHHKQSKHFTGLYASEGFFQVFDNEEVKHWNVGQEADLAGSDDVTFFQLQYATPKNIVVTKNLDAFIGGAPKKDEEYPRYVCPLTACVCSGCHGTLLKHCEVASTLYDLAGPQEVIVVTKQCSVRSCRASYGYNYVWQNGSKVNAVSLEELVDEVLFVSSKCGFTFRYFKYHEELLYRGHVSARATTHAYNAVFGDEMSVVPNWFRQVHENAFFYMLALREFQKVGLHMAIEIENEISDHAISIYHTFCHSSIFLRSMETRQSLKTLVGDGHGKIRGKCHVAPNKRAGRPRKTPLTVGKHGNGWFIICDPDSGSILNMTTMHEPENNEVALTALKDMLWLYPKVNCFVYDRACAVLQEASQEEALKQIKYYIVDRFHAHKHGKKCKCNPCHRAAIKVKNVCAIY